MDFNNLLLSETESNIYQLTINRPQQLNALNDETLTEIKAAAHALVSHSSVRALIVTGAGDKSFIAGADIKQMQNKSALEAQTFSDLGLSTVQALSDLPFPVIAAVNGYALGGGCELALACDWIIAADNARFGQPEVKLGVPPGFGGSQRLPRRIGTARALEMICSGELINAETALSWGLVNHVYPQDQLLPETMNIARIIAAQAPIAVSASKKLIHDGEGVSLAQANSMENRAFATCFATEDQKEGMEAFVEKRKAVFQGK